MHDRPLGKRRLGIADPRAGLIGLAVDPGLVDPVAVIIGVALEVVHDDRFLGREVPDLARIGDGVDLIDPPVVGRAVSSAGPGSKEWSVTVLAAAVPLATAFRSVPKKTLWEPASRPGSQSRLVSTLTPVALLAGCGASGLYRNVEEPHFAQAGLRS